MASPHPRPSHGSKSSVTKSPASTARRVHSDAQLVRKRQVDRLKQKSNRDENKRRMENLERNVETLLAAVEDISQHFRRRPGTDLSSSPPSTMSPDNVTTAHAHPALEVTAARPSCLYQDLGRDQTPRGSPTSPPGFPGLRVQCRCGVTHQTQLDCLEYSSYAILYQAHIGIAQDPLRPPPQLPLNPPLVNMMLLSTDGNPVAFFVTTVLRQFEIADTQTLFGLYLVAYRFLRWRLYPDPASLEDVPPWLRPTPIQQSRLHPLCIDYIPWPALRDFLCLAEDRDRRHSVALYIRSLRLAWPAATPLLLTDPRAGVVLHPGFADVAMDIRHWSLGPPWADEFPQLARYVTY